MTQLYQTHSSPVSPVALGPARVIFASPHLLGDFADIHAFAIESTRNVFRLNRGELGRAADRLLGAAGPLEHQMDLLRTLAQTDPRQGAYWRNVWPRLMSHFHIEMGTQLLLRSPRMNDAAAALVGALIEQRAQIDIVCDWSASLLDVLATVLLPHLDASQLFAPIDRGRLASGRKGLWIGQAWQGSSEARRRGHTALHIDDVFDSGDLKDATAFLGSEIGRQDDRPVAPTYRRPFARQGLRVVQA